ncbi:MAG TPA: M1 family aminopeptidase [Syntrophobacter fumaroxidans]|nr:M1 family aminopeptidase [Syntrophobacter fumaroxidans]
MNRQPAILVGEVMGSLRSALWAFILSGLLPGIITEAGAKPATSIHYDIAVRIETASGALEGSGTVTVRENGAMPPAFTLRPDARVHSVTGSGGALPYRFEGGVLRIPRSALSGSGDRRITIRYAAAFHDAIPGDPLYTEDPTYGVTGVISKRGLFLADDSGWYPKVPGAFGTYRIRVDVPAGMEVVTAGTLKERTPDGDRLDFVWESEQPLRGVSLSGGPYAVKTGRAGRIPYFFHHFPGSERLAEPYLSAVNRYITLYEELFGPYPFPKFAVVENFFPTGYGFPSYTLLGSQVIRLPFIVDTSLGHEVAHSWWGNGVFVDYGKGNWSEGLTTYVADHLYKEKISSEEAREYRARILRNYATLVSPREDFPLAEFAGRDSPPSRAVGYGKGAMVFHMARKLAGDDGFWQALKDVCQKRLFQETSWSDFAEAFAARSRGTDFHAFFRQWVDRPGAPTLRIDRVEATKVADAWKVRGFLMQEAPFFELFVPLRLATESGEIFASVFVKDRETTFSIDAGSRPRRLTVDPDADLFRRLHPEEVPPDINAIKGSDALVAVMAAGQEEMMDGAARALLSGLGRQELVVVRESELLPAQLKGKDLLVFGFPRTKQLFDALPGNLSVATDHFSLDETVYGEPGDGAFFALRSGIDTSRSAGLFLAFSREAADVLARKIPHYGSYSVVVIRDNNVAIKKVWPVADSPLIHRFTSRE